MKNNGHIYSGFVIMIIGVLLMLGNMGVISWSILSGFSQIWPLIFVAIGLNMFFNNHIFIRMLTFSGLVVALIVTGMAYPKGDDWNVDLNIGDISVNSDKGQMAVSKEYPTEQVVTSGEVNLKIPAGAIEMKGQEPYLLKLRHPGSGVKESVESINSGSRKVFNLDGGSLVIGFKSPDDKWNYRYELNNKMPWDVRIDAGATDAKLDFSDVLLKSLELNSGAGDIDIKIGKVDRKAIVAVDVKASDFRILIPKEIGYRAVIKGGIKDVTIDGHDYVRDGDVYTSYNYSTAAHKVDLNLDVGVGDIQIDR